ncbi:hypothetical protein AB0E01_15180 [Nocardia vinacea]|uniref:hypothetical protein n=1 Tax=Nocardia vinacea TaxID=96468 RepID=UPI0033C14A13
MLAGTIALIVVAVALPAMWRVAVYGGTDLCAAKCEAFWTLVDTGRTVPDVRAMR